MKSLVFQFFIFMTIPISFCQSVLAREITGTVTDNNHRPLAGVMVKTQCQSGKTVGFMTTRGDGKYSINIPDSLGNEVLLRFDKIDFSGIVMTLEELLRNPDITLTPEGKTLEEIVVLPSPIRAHGDTVTYSVDALRHVSDRTIEDVIRHLPGVRVSSQGRIYYNGEAINNFYVEGLDMLGGRYSLASRNIRADDVASVDIYENHQPVKALKDIDPSDKAAMNLKLKKRSMLRPTGYIEGGAGIPVGKERWRGEAFSMLISPAAHTYITAKATNFGSGYGFDNIIHNSQFLDASSPFDNIYELTPVSGLGGISASRFMDILSQIYTVNTGFKPHDDATMRLNVSYENGRDQWEGKSITQYSVGDTSTPVELSRDASSKTGRHEMNLGGSYELNRGSLYLGESLAFRGLWSNGSARLLNNPPPDVGQSIHLKQFSLFNNLSLIVRKKSTVWQLSSRVAYSSVPDNILDAEDAHGLTMVHQQAASSVMATYHNTSFSFSAGRHSILGIDLSIGTRHTGLDSYNIINGNGIRNDINRQRGDKVQVDLGPYWQLTSSKIVLRVDVPVQLKYLGISRLDPERFENGRFNNMRVNPGLRVRLNYAVSNSLKMNMSLGRSESSGDIGDFILAPVYSSYRQKSVRGTGALSSSSSWNGTLFAEYRDALNGFFGSVRLMARRSRSGLIMSKTVSEESEEIEAVAHKNGRTVVQGVLNVSKLVGRSTLKLNVENTRLYGKTIRNGKEYSLSNDSWNVEASATLEMIGKKLSIDPIAVWNINRSSFNAPGTRNGKLHNWKVSSPVAVHPVRGLEIKLLPWFSANQQYDGDYFKSFFLDASARYSVKRWQFEARLSNLTDRRKLIIADISDMAVYTDVLRLRGLETLFTVKYSF